MKQIRTGNEYEISLRADLRWANLRWADLRGADLADTCLDPNANPNGDSTEFMRDGDFVVGYRTAISPIMGGEGYVAGKTYEATVFSVAETECHPGLYLCPTPIGLEGAKLKVWAKPDEIHRAGTNWRCKKFYKVENYDENPQPEKALI